VTICSKNITNYKIKLSTYISTVMLLIDLRLLYCYTETERERFTRDSRVIGNEERFFPQIPVISLIQTCMYSFILEKASLQKLCFTFYNCTVVF